MTHFKHCIQIGKDSVGPGQPVYLVAEMSANHAQDFHKAVDIIHAAKEAGANAVKLQTYSADTLTLDCKNKHFYITRGPWKGQYMYELYQSAMMPWDWHADLKAIADKVGITLFSAPFDASAVDLLVELDVPALKIASPELIDLELIARAAASGKPIIISTGLGTLGEIDEAVRVVRQSGNRELCLLKCTSEYPAPYSTMNLRTITHLHETFGCPAGLSDHSLGISVPITAVAMGACMIEKHFILSRNETTADSFFSLTQDEFKQMVASVRQAEQAMGKIDYASETCNSRRSLYAANDIAEGEQVTRQNVRNLRPGVGLAPKYLAKIIGAKARRAIKRGEPMYWDMIELEPASKQ